MTFQSLLTFPRLANRPGQPEMIELTPQNCCREFVDQWTELASHSMSGNAFLTPQFVLSVGATRPADHQPRIIACQDRTQGKLLGLGVFDSVRGTKALPLPHLTSLQSPHSFRDGLLVDEDRRSEFYQHFLEYLSRRNDECYGVEFRKLRLNSQWCLELREYAAEHQASFRHYPESTGPIVDMPLLSKDGLSSYWSASRRKSYRKNRNRLAKYGEIQFQFVEDSHDWSPAYETFLRLEADSWKGELGTALKCRTEECQFAWDLLRHSEGTNYMAISQLLAGNRIAATAINLRVGKELFAFKIAWDSDFANCSPGTLHEVEMVNYIAKHKPTIERIDGCAGPESYLSKIWPHQTQIGRALLCTTTLARGAGKFISKLQSLKRWANSFSSPETPNDASS